MSTYLPKFVFSLLIVFGANIGIFSQTPLDKEEYVIYSALLKTLFTEYPQQNLTISRVTTTISLNKDGVRSLLKKTSLLNSFFLQDYIDRNKSQVDIENKFEIERKVNLVNEEDIYAITQRGFSVTDLLYEKGWKEFRKQYGSSQFIYLSRVGFNQKRNRAFLLFGYQTGWLGGEGTYYILEKGKSGWKIKKKIFGWIS